MLTLLFFESPNSEQILCILVHTHSKLECAFPCTEDYEIPKVSIPELAKIYWFRLQHSNTTHKQKSTINSWQIHNLSFPIFSISATASRHSKTYRTYCALLAWQSFSSPNDSRETLLLTCTLPCPRHRSDGLGSAHLRSLSDSMKYLYIQIFGSMLKEMSTSLPYTIYVIWSLQNILGLQDRHESEQSALAISQTIWLMMTSGGQFPNFTLYATSSTGKSRFFS